jgi:hypothetical protein
MFGLSGGNAQPNRRCTPQKLPRRTVPRVAKWQEQITTTNVTCSIDCKEKSAL